MRTPNTECCICGKPLYRRPYELAKFRHVACMKHRAEAQVRSGITEQQRAGLAMGRAKGTNHLNGIPKSEESKRKRSEAMKRWCTANPDLVAARAAKTKDESHYQWRGGASRLNTSIRQLPQHRKWVRLVISRDGQCRQCGATEELEAHHLVELAAIVETEGIKSREQAKLCQALWDTGNGIALCRRCHCEHHGRSYTPTGMGRRQQSKRQAA
jgi:hypothetical protein